MRGAVLLLLLSQQPGWWATPRPQGPGFTHLDAGAPDAGAPDAGVAVAPRDAGRLPDGGRADAGEPPPPPPPPPSAPRWEHGDGGWLDEKGVTDRVRLRVGERVELRFPHPVIQTQCDAPLVTITGTADTLIFTGAVEGATHCGFWFWQQGWPHRYVDLVVSAR